MSAQKKNVGGRPPRAESASTVLLQIRLTEAEHAAITAAAVRAVARSRSEWIRRVLAEAAAGKKGS